MRCTRSLSLFVSDRGRICCYTTLPSLGGLRLPVILFCWLHAVSRYNVHVPLYFLYCTSHFPLLTFYGQFVKTISYFIIKLLIFWSTLLDKGVIVRPIAI